MRKGCLERISPELREMIERMSFKYNISKRSAGSLIPRLIPSIPDGTIIRLPKSKKTKLILDLR